MIQIYYCVEWNYFPRAASLAEIIKSKCGIDSELLSGKKGEFTVWYNGIAIADKNFEVCDVFPSQLEIADIIWKLQQENCLGTRRKSVRSSAPTSTTRR